MKTLKASKPVTLGLGVRQWNVLMPDGGAAILYSKARRNQLFGPELLEFRRQSWLSMEFLWEKGRWYAYLD